LMSVSVHHLPILTSQWKMKRKNNKVVYYVWGLSRRWVSRWQPWANIAAFRPDAERRWSCNDWNLQESSVNDSWMCLKKLE
jgi:hypothetical protein